MSDPYWVIKNNGLYYNGNADVYNSWSESRTLALKYRKKRYAQEDALDMGGKVTITKVSKSVGKYVIQTYDGSYFSNSGYSTDIYTHDPEKAALFTTKKEADNFRKHWKITSTVRALEESIPFAPKCIRCKSYQYVIRKYGSDYILVEQLTASGSKLQDSANHEMGIYLGDLETIMSAIREMKEQPSIA